MKVLLLGPYPPPHGGVQIHVVALREFLEGRGVTCSVINLTRFRHTERDGVYYPQSAWELLRLLIRLRYDIVHLHIGGHLSRRLLGLCLFCSLLPGAASILTFHSGGYPSSPAGRTASRWSLRGYVLRRMDHLIAVNQELVELFRRFGCDPSRISLVPPHAVAAAPGAASASLPRALQAFYAQHDPVLVTVGLLEPEYDLALQIECMGSIRQQYPNAGLVIIGSGSLEEDLRTQIARCPWAAHVLLQGDLPHGLTLRAIADGNVLLRTTHYDGDSISVREAIHLGTPVIATDNGMRPAGVTLIPASNPEALRTTVAEVLTDPRAAASPSPDASTDNLETVLTVYRNLVAVRRPSA